jgi:hypothetical protein
MESRIETWCPLGSLPVDVLTAVAARMGELDPLANVEISVCCPQCSHEWQAPFDIASFSWAEIDAWGSPRRSHLRPSGSRYGCRAQARALGPTLSRQWARGRVACAASAAVRTYAALPRATTAVRFGFIREGTSAQVFRIRVGVGIGIGIGQRYCGEIPPRLRFMIQMTRSRCSASISSSDSPSSVP